MLALEEIGRFTCTPNPGFSRNDSFVYLVGDGVDSASATVTISVAPNTAATDVSLNNGSVLEARPPGAVVETLSTADKDSAHVYSIVAGSAPFAIDGNKLVSAVESDYETAQTHSVMPSISRATSKASAEATDSPAWRLCNRRVERRS